MTLSRNGLPFIDYVYYRPTETVFFYKFGRNRNETENNVVSAENETEAEFNALFRPKPKPKINNAEYITYVYNPKRRLL